MKRILIIEDDQHFNRIYNELLSEYELGFATNGHSGFRLAVSNDYDLIIVDLQVPAWNGAETLMAIEVVKPAARFLVVSGYLHNKDYQLILQASRNIMETISKPVKIDELKDKIVRYVSQVN